MPEPLSPKIGFGMNVASCRARPGDVLDDVLELHQVVGGVLAACRTVVDLGLAGGADLVVAALDGRCRRDRALQDHLVAQVGEVVVGGTGK
jgi:hypothetical protein